MKKIIAAAVATAFVAPAFAADVSLSGDLEMRYVFSADDGPAAKWDDADIKVNASEELPNGMSVSAFLAIEDLLDANGDHNAVAGGEAELTISRADFGAINMGDGDVAAQRVDELASPADTDGGDGNAAADGRATRALTVNWTLPEMVSGLQINASYTLDDVSTSNGADNEESTTSLGIKYTMGDLNVAYGTVEDSSETFTTTYVGFNYSIAGFTVGMDTASDVAAEGEDKSTLGATYALADGIALYVEKNEIKGSSADEDTDIMGLTYAVGGGLALRLENVDSSTDTADATTVAVTYAF